MQKSKWLKTISTTYSIQNHRQYLFHWTWVAAVAKEHHRIINIADANEKDQDSSKEQCVTAATDFAEARGLKYSVLAKIPTMHVNVNVPAKHVDKEAVN